MTIEKAIRLARKWAAGHVCTLKEGEAQEYHQMCAEALEKSRWISVEERLPEEWRSANGDLINYMVFMPAYGVDIGNFLQPANKWLCMGIPAEVTHWMPLPEGPEVEV